MKKLGEIIKSSSQAKIANIEKYESFLVELMPKYGINTPLRQRHFLAQILHESGCFAFVKENLNYSANGLLKTFPKYFKTMSEATEYERKPEKIANRVYADRMGNGSEASGEPSKFIGRGLIQVTGKSNYIAVSKGIFGDDRLISYPELLEQPVHAVESACWWWNKNGLNEISDKNDIEAVTRRVNGGLNGLSERKKYFENLKTLEL